MILFFSIFITIIIYIVIIFSFYKFILLEKKELTPPKEVLIHTAIIKPKPVQKKSMKFTKKRVITHKKKIVKHKKNGSKNSITKGGKNIKFEDIFKNVNYNVETKKIEHKQEIDISRFKGIERNLDKIKNLSYNVSYNNNNYKKSKNKLNDAIIKKISEVWYKISEIDSEYAKIQIININNKLFIKLLDSNLPLYKQQLLINEIKKIKFNSDFDVTITFKTKAQQHE